MRFATARRSFCALLYCWVAARVRLENWIPEQDTEGLNLEWHFRHGAPHAEVIDFAADSQVDLIIMGTHGRGVAAHLLLGSVAEKVEFALGMPGQCHVRAGDDHTRAVVSPHRIERNADLV